MILFDNNIDIYFTYFSIFYVVAKYINTNPSENTSLLKGL